MRYNEYDPYATAEEVNSLPTKRIFDFESKRLRESTKLQSEFNLPDDDANELVLKVKLAGINYQTDFQSFLYNGSSNTTLYNNYVNRTPETKKSPLVPGTRIIGKVQLITSHPDLAQYKENPNSKYMVFPFSNCINQSTKYCNNCALLCYRLPSNSSKLSERTLHHWSKYPCMKEMIYGSTIDGGLQDYIKISTPSETLLRIPENVSLHDACFFLDIMLPFYVFCKEYFMDTPLSPISVDGNDDFFTNKDMVNFGGNVLIILNNVGKEINDILIVLKHFGIDENTVRFIDHNQYNLLTEERRRSYKGQFSQIFVFDPHSDLIKFANLSSSSQGLEVTKSRYNIIIFDQFCPASLAKNKYLQKQYTDKTYHQFKLSYKDRLYAQKLLDIISNLNASVKQHEHDNSIPLSPVSRSSSTFSTQQSVLSSTNSGSSEPQIESKPLKSIRFRDDESIIEEQYSKKSVTSYTHTRRHFSWLWYDKDIALCNDYEQSDDEGDDDEISYELDPRKSHSVKQVNELVHNPQLLHRVCYTSRMNKPVKLNAFIFS